MNFENREQDQTGLFCLLVKSVTDKKYDKLYTYKTGFLKGLLLQLFFFSADYLLYYHSCIVFLQADPIYNFDIAFGSNA